MPPAVVAAPVPEVPPDDSSPTADSWENEADNALLTEENNEPEEEENEPQVAAPVISMSFNFFFELSKARPFGVNTFSEKKHIVLYVVSKVQFQ